MIVDTEQHKSYLEFASRLTGTKDFGNCKTIAFKGKDWLSVVVYNALDESNIGISIATNSPKWCSKRVLKVIFGFPFVQLGLNRVTATINENNSKSISLVERLGFILEGKLIRYYRTNESALIYRMLNTECRWIK